MKISKHAMMRMRERTGLNHKNRRGMFRRALDKGKNIQDIKNKEVRGFVKCKQKRCMIKLYEDYLYIYSKYSKQLYTMYKLPEELQNREIYRR